MTGKQKKYLRGLAHDMKPLVQIGQRGLTAAVTGQIDSALTDHELIKVRVAAEAPVDRKVLATQLADRLGCGIAGSIGRVLILFRANPDEPRIELPTAPATEGE
jgi:RNA-binding protein